MSEIKHTPGPWDRSGSRIKMNGLQWHRIFKYSPDTKKDVNIACVIYDADTGDGFADACLIAAAPELLDALENLCIGVGMGWDLDGMIEVAQAAIAKAGGHSWRTSSRLPPGR